MPGAPASRQIRAARTTLGMPIAGRVFRSVATLLMLTLSLVMRLHPVHAKRRCDLVRSVELNVDSRVCSRCRLPRRSRHLLDQLPWRADIADRDVAEVARGFWIPEPCLLRDERHRAVGLDARRAQRFAGVAI